MLKIIQNYLTIMLVVMATGIMSACSPEVDKKPPTPDVEGGKLLSDKDITIFEKDPIAGIGHGSLIDKNGNSVKATPKIIASLQKHYSDNVLELLDEKELDAYQVMRGRIFSNEKIKPKTIAEQLTINAGILDWLIDRARIDDAGALQGKNNLLKAKIWEVAGTKIRPGIIEAIPKPGNYTPLFATVNSGTAYLTECAEVGNDVPTPPNWGDNQWVSTGSLTDSQEFISRTSEAKPYVYISAAPAGVCIALPRELGGSNGLLGIICQSEVSGKACFWDNQRNDTGYPIPLLSSGQFVPIEDTNMADNPNIPDHADGTDMDFAGGAELFGGSGGICSGCHAGENVFNLHPGTALRPNLGGSDTMPSVWYEPIVDNNWPQNPGPGTLAMQAEADSCSACHMGVGASAGRFPKLSWNFLGASAYCAAVLKNAINIDAGDPVNTMPLGGVLNAADHMNLVAVIDDFCDGNPALAEGEPHITTTDNVRYDFQAAGEFVLLKGYDDFEVQMRSRALATSFFPGPNSHTELATCTSSISAVATRVGSDRLTYQPGLDGIPDPAGMELRVNGTIRSIPSSGLTLAGGGRVSKNSSDIVEVIYPDGEIMTLTPRFWASQGHWYLNVSVGGAEANRGIMGRVSNGWLPSLPNGTSLGSKPASTSQRYNQLNGTFANAWRVSNSSSMFDYAPGQSSANFTIPAWPKDTAPCEVPDIELAPPGDLAAAQRVCGGIVNSARKENCIFDVTVTGDVGFARQFKQSERLEKSGTATIVRFHKANEKLKRPPLFMAKVRLKRTGLKRTAQGYVQFFENGERIGKPVELDKRGIAFLAQEKFDPRYRKSVITAQYIPAKELGYLPSVSNSVRFNID